MPLLVQKTHVVSTLGINKQNIIVYAQVYYKPLYHSVLKRIIWNDDRYLVNIR